MKASNQFKDIIQAYLNKRGEDDPLFAETLKKPGKNIDDCLTYIFNTVQASGCNGFADEEVFQMAVHYYDEDDIKVGTPVSGQVVVNRKVELTDEDKQLAKKEAMDRLINEEQSKIKKVAKEKKNPAKKVKNNFEQEPLL